MSVLNLVLINLSLREADYIYLLSTFLPCLCFFVVKNTKLFKAVLKISLNFDILNSFQVFKRSPLKIIISSFIFRIIF